MKIRIPKFIRDAIIARAKKTPFTHLEGYMNRFWFFNPNGFLARWKTVRVHEILRSDLDRHLHDHPWAYRTVILEGSYTEVTHWPTFEGAYSWARKEGRTFDGLEYSSDLGVWVLFLRYVAGCTMSRPANFAHRLIVPAGQKVTTLFIMGQYEQKWGFMTEGGKVPYDQYLALKK